MVGWPHPDYTLPSSLASDVIGDLRPLARISGDPAIRLAHEGLFA
jgi:hypothetical protein